MIGYSNDTFSEGLRYTVACYAGNVSLTTYCPVRLKENLAFLRDYVRRGSGCDALGCMVENIFLGDKNDRRYAALIRWYDRHHPGAAPIIVSCLEQLVEVGESAELVKRIRARLHKGMLHQQNAAPDFCTRLMMRH